MTFIHQWSPGRVETTVGLLFALLLLSRAGDALIRRRVSAIEHARQLHVGLHYSLSIICALGVAFIWAQEVRHFAFAAATLLAALLVTCKDLITALFGTIFRAYGGTSPLGELVEIDGCKGIVVGSNLLMTRLQLLDNTGSPSDRIRVFSNSVFLSTPVTRLSGMGSYRLSFLRVPLSTSDNLAELAQYIRSIVDELIRPNTSEARDALEAARRSSMLALPSLSARVFLEPVSSSEVVLVARFPCAASHQSELEQEVLARFYRRLAASREPARAVVARRSRP